MTTIRNSLNICKNNRGVSLIEASIAVFLAAGVGYVSMEAQENTTKQISSSAIYQTSAVLRDSFQDLIRDKGYVEADIRDRASNSNIKGCIPTTFGFGAKFTGPCSLNRDTPIELAKPDDSSRLRFYGGTLGDGIIAGKNTSYYTETGEVCENNDSLKCNIAVQASLKAVCVNTTECGANGPDLLKITVEIKDNRTETKVAGSNARSVNWAQKPSIYKFFTIHDLTHLKQVADADLQANGCPSLDGDPGYPLGLQGGKIVCGYHNPEHWVGDKGRKGVKGADGRDGNPGPAGFMGPPGPRGRNCMVNRSGNGCSNEERTQCPRTYVVSC